MSLSKIRKLDSKLIGSNIEFDSLNEECINNIFDWLSIEDLCKVKVTCKRLFLLANEHYRITYGQVNAWYGKGVGSLDERNKYHKSFASSAQRVNFYYDLELSTMSSIVNQNVKYISLYSYDSDLIDTNLQNKFKNVKEISVGGPVNDNLLQHFPNLEVIDIKFTYQWSVLGNYPKLKQVRHQNFKKRDEQELEQFFKRNPNIKVFASIKQATETTDWVLRSGLEFDDLVLMVGSLRVKPFVDVDQLIKNLHSLHKNQQIKRLHLQICNEEFFYSPKFKTLKFVESIETTDPYSYCEKSFNIFASLPNLKCLTLYCQFGNSLNKSQSAFLVQKLDQLEELHINAQPIGDMIPFVRYSAKLKCIYLMKQPYGRTFKEGNTTVHTLDKSRRELKHACKLTIYMDEEQYLHVKNNSSTSRYGLVEIKRVDSYPLSKHLLRPYSDTRSLHVP